MCSRVQLFDLSWEILSSEQLVIFIHNIPYSPFTNIVLEFYCSPLPTQKEEGGWGEDNVSTSILNFSQTQNVAAAP